MTISTPLSPARTHAFQSTLSAQHKRSGQVQFSLPPVKDPTAPSGSSTPASGSIPQLAASGAAALSLITLPIARPVGGFGGVGTTATPPPAGATTVTPPPRPGGISLPIALTSPPSGLAATAAAGTAPSQGNILSAPLITRLYQQQG
jgi:hypothetical protein